MDLGDSAPVLTVGTAVEVHGRNGKVIACWTWFVVVEYGNGTFERVPIQTCRPLERDIDGPHSVRRANSGGAGRSIGLDDNTDGIA